MNVAVLSIEQKGKLLLFVSAYGSNDARDSLLFTGNTSYPLESKIKEIVKGSSLNAEVFLFVQVSSYPEIPSNKVHGIFPNRLGYCQNMQYPAKE